MNVFTLTGRTDQTDRDDKFYHRFHLSVSAFQPNATVDVSFSSSVLFWKSLAMHFATHNSNIEQPTRLQNIAAQKTQFRKYLLSLAPVQLIEVL